MAKTHAAGSSESNDLVAQIADPLLRQEVERLFENARKYGLRPSVKHHIVPRSYLARWEHSGTLRVVDVNNRTTFTNAADNVGIVRHFYNLASSDLDPERVPPMLMETVLGEVEGAAVKIIDQLLDAGPESLRSDQFVMMAGFLAFQYTRGVGHREFIEEGASFHSQVTLGNAGELYVRQVLGEDASEEDIRDGVESLREIRDGTIKLRPQRAESVWLAASGAEAVVPLLLGREWMVYHSLLPLITCDEPVFTICSPDLDVGQTWGVSTPGVVVFPLSPTSVLALVSLDLVERMPPSGTLLTAQESESLNAWLAGNAYRWAFCRSDSTAAAVPLVPPPAPSFEVDYHHRRASGLFRIFNPSRWRYAQSPNRPESWWN